MMLDMKPTFSSRPTPTRTLAASTRGELAHLRHAECLAQPGGLGVRAWAAAGSAQQGAQVGCGERGGPGLRAHDAAARAVCGQRAGFACRVCGTLPTVRHLDRRQDNRRLRQRHLCHRRQLPRYRRGFPVRRFQYPPAARAD